jgi:type IV fimbrial biogenesis protein FimT
MLAQRPSGFTLIEIMISLTVLGLLLMMALPSFTEALQNQQLRAASEGMVNGFQVARAAAIRRNVPVQIVVGPGTGWTVSEVASASLVQARSKDEASPNAAVAITPAGATTVTFTPIGGVAANADASATITQLDITNPAGGACQPTGPMRCLRVLVTGGGSVRMCDPAVPAVTPPDPRGCS